MKTVRDWIIEQGQRYGEKPFLLFPERQETVTYSQLWDRCIQTAHYLHSLGVVPGDKVALLLPNIPEFLYFYWGAMFLGAVAGPVNTLLKGPEIQFIIHHCEAKVVVTTGEFAAELNRALSDLPLIEHCVLVEDGVETQFPKAETLRKSWQKYDVSKYGLDPIATPLSPDDEAMIIYTSGTTGNPKGVLLTHRNLLADAAYIRDWFKITPEARLMCILPLFHVNGEVVTLMTPLVSGASVVLNRKFSAASFWETIRHYGVTAFSTVPTILSILVAQGKPDMDYPTLEFAICGAAPLPVEVHKQFEAVFGIPVFEGYGLSETTCYSTFNPRDLNSRKIGSIGVAVGNEVAIWDDDCRPLPPGEAGEIVIRGENVMKGYYKRPDANEEAFRGGWFHSGDWGKMDEDGFFFILDRIKDMIIRGGENIYPRDIDEVLYRHPKISAAATIGVPDKKYGEEVKSFVVLKPGETLTEPEVLTYCREFLADYKCPKTVAFIEEIPKGPTGKLLRRLLRDM